ncbi:MAG: hypothetical protein K1X75_04440 [Leptospirales bacterium]|nr:hypothetical protein [Leptospirales bacterium]
MPRWNLFVIGAYLLYFATLATGRPALERPQAILDREPIGFRQQAQEAAEGGVTGPDQPLAQQPAPHWIWSPGLVERLVAQRSLLAPFADPLLESDARPDQLERSLERGYAADVLALLATIFWTTLLALLIPAMRARLWFYGPMSAGALGFSGMVILYRALIDRSLQILSNSIPIYDQITGLGEILLALAGVAVAMDRLLPARHSDEAMDRAFMAHIRPADSRQRQALRRALYTILHMVAIFLAAVLVSNLALLPLYYLQVQLPGWFTGLLAGGLALLAYYYVRAYRQVGRAQSPAVAWSGPAAFLGYRFLSNALFLFSLLAVVVVGVLAIVSVVLNNIAALQGAGMLPPPDAL